MTMDDTRRGDRADLAAAELPDGLAIRRLVDAYASFADRLDAAGQMVLFTEDTDFLLSLGGRNPSPSQQIRGWAVLAPVFDEFNTYPSALHFNGQTITVLDGGQASGVTYCLAYQVKVDGLARSLITAAIRSLDTLVKRAGPWFRPARKTHGRLDRNPPTCHQLSLCVREGAGYDRVDG